MDIKYVVADPAGNITGLVLTKLPQSDYKAVARYLIEHSPFGLEQVGFIHDCNDCDGSLEMMGGEFCGNASRSFGLYLAKNAISIQDGKVLIRVSGVSAKLEVRTDLKLNEANIKMPPIQALVNIQTKEYGQVPMVVMEGISHVLLIDRHPDQEKGEQLIRELADDSGDDALGVMYYESDHRFLTPLVWVRDTDTMIWESSCGSGSVALASYLEQAAQGDWTQTFKEPGGTLKVERLDGALYLGGPVTFSEVISTKLP